MGLSHEAALDELMYGGFLRVSPSMPTEVDYERSDRDIFVETACWTIHVWNQMYSMMSVIMSTDLSNEGNIKVFNRQLIIDRIIWKY
jgi:hypothetical protein